MAEEGKEDCQACKGKGFCIRNVILYTPCLECGGKGTVLWIDNAVRKSKPPTPHILQDVIMRNISTLTSELRYEGSKMGLDIEVVPRRRPNPCSEIRFFMDEARSLDLDRAEEIGFFPDEVMRKIKGG